MSDQMTIRVKDKQEIERERRRLEVKYDLFLTARPNKIYTAIFQLAYDNPTLLAAKLEEVQEGG
ncbi:hypothetical protein [Natrinema salifodinae]|uniref:Uncharacterized protein n=1 Tax=Natrinema salifodinae TaxID=1202768 RepID=A0A1I0P350_9EURY|nr:hypothetical protein [Natrinema salifodinae]SEW08629.1 hypothetical protein SAMN05216285_2089 [Natrinema salifodinae]